MITTTTVYVTSDSRHFFSEAEAKEHEQNALFQKEVEEVVTGLSISEPIRSHMRKAIIAWEARK
jgi:hypothetical protein